MQGLFDDLPRLVQEAEPAALPSIIAALEGAKAAAWARITAAVGSPCPPAEPETDEPLDAGAAAALIHVERKWLLRHTKGKRFRHDLSRKVVKFDRRGLLRWIQSRPS